MQKIDHGLISLFVFEYYKIMIDFLKLMLFTYNGKIFMFILFKSLCLLTSIIMRYCLWLRSCPKIPLCVLADIFFFIIIQRIQLS